MNNPICTIVGAGMGLDLALARRFARENFHITLLARRAETLNEQVDLLRQAGAAADGFSADAADPQSLINAFAQLHAQLGVPQVLIYNAAVIQSTIPSELSQDRLHHDFQVNVASALLSAQQVIPHMKNQQRGTLLITGGGLALSPVSEYAALALGKAALRNLCYTLGAELAPAGIHVATVTVCGYISPGTHFDPDRIAEAFWNLHAQTPGTWEREIIYE